MSDNQFDEFIKKKLENYPSAVPNDMWDRIQAGSKKRRGAILWKNGGLLLLIITAITAGILFYNKENAIVHDALITSKSNTGKIIEAPSAEANNENDKEVDYKKQDATGSNEVVGSTDNSANVTIKENKGSAKEGERELGEAGITRLNSISRSNNKFNRSDKSLLFKRSVPAQNLVDNDFNNYNLQSNPLSLLALHEKAFAESKSDKEALKNLTTSLGIDCPPSYADRRNDWYVEVFASPDYAFKSVNNNYGNEVYLQRKDSTEQFQTAFSAGVRISKSIGENLLLKTGLTYSQINERFRYTIENERKLITVITTHVIIRNPGDTVIVKDTSTAEQIGYKYKTTKNRYRSVDIPLIFAYEWGNDRWKANLNAGAIFNIYSWQKGEMLDTTFTPVSFDKNNRSVFKQNLGVGLYAGLTILKPLNEYLDLFAEPYFRYNLSDMTREKSPFAQKFHMAGINLGIRYKINGNRQR